MKHEVDLFIIGAGSGGVRAARMAAREGARVAIAEDRYMGGTCVNVGCVPKKLYSFAAHYRHDFEDSVNYGWSGLSPAFDWETLKRNKTNEISRLNNIYEKMLEGVGVELIHGRASIEDANTVVVGERRVGARHILIASGGWPHIPDIPGRELAISSNEIFDLPVFPRRLLVVGGGYIAVEFAAIFAGLGSQVSLCVRRAMPLNGFDEDVRQAFFSEIQHYLRPLMNTQVTSLTQDDHGGITAVMVDGNGSESQDSFDCVLYATGRRPNTKGLGLDRIGIELSAGGAIPVDANFKTSCDSIYAVGDVIDRLALTPVALAEGMAVVSHLFGNGSRTMHYENIPSAVFAQPNIASVGLTETQARQRHGDGLAIFKTNFRHLRHTISGRNERTFMKVIVERGTDKVLGMHMMGAEAGEIIQGFAAAMQCGMTKAQLDATIGIHPTAAEEFVTLREEAPQD